MQNDSEEELGLSIRLRQATKKDIDFLASNTAKLAYETEKMSLDIKKVKKNFELGFKYPVSMQFWIATTAKENIDIGSLFFTIGFNIPRNSPFTWLQSIFVRNKFRGRKAFSKLFFYCKYQAEKNSNFGLKLHVKENNASATKIYKHYGMAFLNCDVYEADLVYGFSDQDFDQNQGEGEIVDKDIIEDNIDFNKIKENIDFDKADENYVKLKEIFSSVEFFKINNPNEYELIQFESNNEGKTLFSRLSKGTLNIEDFNILLRVNEISTIDPDSYYKGLAHYFLDPSKSGSFFALTRKVGDYVEIVGLICTFVWYSDWHGGNVHLVYDVRFKRNYAEVYPDLLSILNLRLLDLMKNEGVKSFMWEVFEGDDHILKDGLLRIGYRKSKDHVMLLRF